MLIALISITVITSASFAAGASSDYVGVTKNGFYIYYLSTKYATAPENDTTQFVLMTVDSIEVFSDSTNVSYSIQILFDKDAVQPGLIHDVIDHEIPEPINIDPEDFGYWLLLAFAANYIMSYEGGWIVNKQLLPKDLTIENATSGDLISIKYDSNGVLESVNLINPDSTSVSEFRILRLNLYIYIGAGVLGAVLLIVIISVSVKKRRKT
jgi:hypothetical protein